MEYEVPKELENLFEFKKYDFQTHEELDLFVKKIYDSDKSLIGSRLYGLDLLKGFDRAFWLRHYKIDDNDNYMPLELKDENNIDFCACPFSDPKKTKSFGKDNWVEDPIIIELNEKTDEVSSNEKSEKLQILIDKKKPVTKTVLTDDDDPKGE